MSDSEHDAGLSFSSADGECSDLHSESDVDPPIQETRPSAKAVATASKERPTRRKVLPAKLLDGLVDGCMGELTSEFGYVYQKVRSANLSVKLLAMCVYKLHKTSMTFSSHLYMYVIYYVGSVIVRCAQTGKQHFAKVKDLSREDCSPLTKKDLTRGTNLMLDYKGKSYPVTFIQFKGWWCNIASLAFL